MIAWQTEGSHCLEYRTHYRKEGKNVLGLQKTYCGMFRGGTQGKERGKSRCFGE